MRYRKKVLTFYSSSLIGLYNGIPVYIESKKLQLELVRYSKKNVDFIHV